MQIAGAARRGVRGLGEEHGVPRNDDTPRHLELGPAESGTAGSRFWGFSISRCQLMAGCRSMVPYLGGLIRKAEGSGGKVPKGT